MFINYRKEYPKLADEFSRIFIKKILPNNWKKNLPKFNSNIKGTATRNISGIVLNKIAENLTELIGGSADLTPSNKTKIKCWDNFQYNNYKGRFLHLV